MSQNAPFLHNKKTVTHVMLQVVLAMLPGIMIWVYWAGWGVIIQITIALISAYAFEYWMLKLRKQDVTLFLTDGSLLITILALALCIPPYAPWWVIFIGSACAVTLGKHVYGGLGFNPFNPAMVAFAILLLSFPLELSLWSDLSEPLNVSLLGSMKIIFMPQSFDTLSAATPLDLIRQANGRLLKTPEHSSVWIYSNAAFLLGGLYLLLRKIISWHVPFSVLLTIALFSLLIGYFDTTAMLPHWHFLYGATLLGAFFIATDPVSCATTPYGKLVFGVIIGLVIVAIRTWGNYPDAIAFAVLTANLCVPIIDYFTQPRVYGK